jgi:hypothetical protein
MYGDGMNVSILKWTGTAMTGQNGINYTNTQQQTVVIYDLSFEAVPNNSSAAVISGTALNFVYPSAQTVLETTVHLQRVSIRPTFTGNTFNPTSKGGWNTCVFTSDAGKANYTDCQFIGNINTGTYGLSLYSTVNPDYVVVEACDFIALDKAFYAAGSASIGGLIINNCDFESCNNGIYINVPTDLMQILGTYIQYYTKGIYSLARTSIITGNRFDGNNDPYGRYSPSILEAIHVGNGVSGPYDGNIISNNNFGRNSTAPVDGIVLDSAVIYSTIQGNTFGSSSSYGTSLRYGVYLLNGSQYNVVTNNVGVFDVCVCHDNSLTNIVYGNKYPGKAGLMPITGATPPLVSGQFDFTLDNMVYLTQTGPTNVTNFLNGFNGQEITIIAGDNYSTIKTSATMIIGTDFAMTGNNSLTLKYDGSAWRQVSRFV